MVYDTPETSTQPGRREGWRVCAQSVAIKEHENLVLT
jgi:hypothetical protein